MLSLMRSNRDLGRLVSARTLSVLGNSFGRVALAFGVLALEGASATDLSIVLACQALPQLVFVLVGGVIADRLPRHRVIIGADLTAAAAWVSIAVFLSLDGVHLLPLAIAAVVAGTATSMIAPAMSGLVPDVVGGGDLQGANAMIRAGQNSAQLVGLSSSGVVVALVGAVPAVSLNALSFVVSAVLLSRVRVPERAGRGETFLADLKLGFSEFFARRWLWVVVAQFSLVLAATNATAGVLGPLVAVERLGGAVAWSVIAAAQAAGTIGGAGLAARFRPERPIRAAVIASSGLALPAFALASGAPLMVIALAACLAGVATDIFSVLWSTTLQRQVPGEVLSRVSSFDVFGSLAFAPLGLLVAGPLAAAVGTTSVLLGCGGLVVLSCVAALASREVRSLRAPRSVDEAV